MFKLFIYPFQGYLKASNIYLVTSVFRITGGDDEKHI